MHRRHVLAGSLALVSGGLGGCLTDVGSDGSATPDPTSTDRATDSGTTGGDPASSAGPSVADTSFRPTDAGCGDGIDEASVAFGEGTVTVTGTISGRDACMHPRLTSATVDAASDELAILVETAAEGEMCSQCLVDLGYEATVRLDGGRPAGVVVRHDSRSEVRTVARATP